MADTDAIDAEIAAVQAELRRWCRRGLGGATLSSSSVSGSSDAETIDAADETIRPSTPGIEEPDEVRNSALSDHKSQTSRTAESSEVYEQQEDESMLKASTRQIFAQSCEDQKSVASQRSKR